jgi:hypothetical protein
VDGNEDLKTTIDTEMKIRVRKSLWSEAKFLGTENEDLWDFIEVLHDLAARPTRGWNHDHNDCGFHPASYSGSQGQVLYRWRINELLSAAACDLRLADSGEDIGRLIRLTTPDESGLLEATIDGTGSSDRETVEHAVSLCRNKLDRTAF